MAKKSKRRSSMGRRAVGHRGDEQDVHTNWRHLLCYLGRPGATSKVKRRSNKRDRQQAKQLLKEEKR